MKSSSSKKNKASSTLKVDEEKNNSTIMDTHSSDLKDNQVHNFLEKNLSTIDYSNFINDECINKYSS